MAWGVLGTGVQLGVDAPADGLVAHAARICVAATEPPMTQVLGGAGEAGGTDEQRLFGAAKAGEVPKRPKTTASRTPKIGGIR